MDSSKIIDFWFKELQPKQWWIKDPEFDKNIFERFGDTHKAAKQGECFSWRSEPLGALAEVIVLDQFSRNIYRDKPEAFAQDPMALTLAQFALEKGFDKQLTESQRSFLFMPFMHSESAAIHEVAVQLYDQPGMEYNLDFEKRHKKIIDDFGRYPHRNHILGRVSTPEEIEFLKKPGSSF